MSHDATQRPLDTASPKSVRDRKKTSAQRRRAEIDDVRAAMASPQAKRFLWRLLEKCGVFVQVDIESTNRVLVNEGKRSIGLHLITELETAHPGALDALRAEFHKDRPNG